MIVDRGVNQRKGVTVGEKEIKFFSAGATTYDKVLADEIKDKYKNDPDIGVIHKSHVRLQGAPKTHHTVPALPWKDD